MITSFANPIVKQARALRRRKTRSETGLFLVEGIHPVGEAIHAGWEIESILYAPDTLTSDFASGLVAQRPAVSHAVSAEVLGTVADKENPQGLVAVVRQKRAQLADLKFLGLGAAVVAPQDPGNVGTILRTLDAIGGGGLFLVDGGVDPYNASSVRASMGALFWIPVFQISFQDLVSWAHQERVQLIASSAHSRLNYRELQPARPSLLVLGSEQRGLSAEHLAACDVAVSIPMRGRASSLNLAVAAAIILYQLADEP